MSNYSLPVAKLFELGDPGTDPESCDYAKLGIDAACESDLIRLMQDRAIAQTDDAHFYGRVRAWRAIGRLGLVSAIPSILDTIEGWDYEQDGDWGEEELPIVLTKLGTAAFAPTVERLLARRTSESNLMTLSTAVLRLAQAHPELRSEAIRAFELSLGVHDPEMDGFNGLLVSHLLDLKAVESWPAIEAAFAAGCVDEFMAGDAETVKSELGLGPKPPRRSSWLRRDEGTLARPDSKSRAAERARKKKKEKRKLRRNR